MSAVLGVGVDGSAHAVAALRFGVDEAIRRGLALRLVHVLDSPSLDRTGSARPWRARRADDRVLADLVDQVQRRAPGLPVQAETRTGDPGTVLVAESDRVTAMVIGTRAGHGFPGIRLGSASVRLALHGHCPVTVVPPRATAPAGPVVVGVDGTPASRLALRYGLDAAAHRGVGLLAVRVWRPPVAQWPYHTAALTEPFELTQRRETERLRAELDRVRGWRPEVPTSARVLAGEPPATLLAVAARAGLLVIGAGRVGPIRGAVQGSVGLHLLGHAPCPVVLVHPHHHTAPPGPARPAAVLTTVS